MFNINDYVFIRPTGDPMIDCFLNQQMTIVDIIPVNDGGYRYTQYMLINATGEQVRVNDNEVQTPFSHEMKEYRNA